MGGWVPTWEAVKPHPEGTSVTCVTPLSGRGPVNCLLGGGEGGQKEEARFTKPHDRIKTGGFRTPLLQAGQGQRGFTALFSAQRLTRGKILKQNNLCIYFRCSREWGWARYRPEASLRWRSPKGKGGWQQLPRCKERAWTPVAAPWEKGVCPNPPG